jgi:HlyD family secretion protein
MTLTKNLGLLLSLFLCATVPALAQISALGRIMPTNGVVDIWGPSGLQLVTIHVEQGQLIEKGSLLATLSNQAQLETEVEQAELALTKAQSALSLEVELQEAIISGLNTDLKNVSKRLKDSYKNKDIISPQIIEEREQTVTSTQNAILKANVVKKKLIALLTLDLQMAERNLEAAKAHLSTGEIRAPIDGTVLIVRKTVGNTLGRGEFIKLGDTSKMSVSAEVYESDISKIKLGQKVRVESVALAEPMTGQVTQKGHMLFSRSVDSLDPRSLTNSRVIEVQVDLDNPKAAKDLIYLQVDVFID